MGIALCTHHSVHSFATPSRCSVRRRYWRYTKDSSPILEHLSKVDGVVTMLLQRRQAVLAAFPNATDPRHGMITGNDEADLWWSTTAGGKTEKAFISITAEAWRGLRDGGEALNEMAEALPPNSSTLAAAARTLSGKMLAQAPAILTDMHASPGHAAFREPVGNVQAIEKADEQADGPAGHSRRSESVVCHPYAAGEATCGELRHAPSSRDSEPWRTYAEALILM